MGWFRSEELDTVDQLLVVREPISNFTSSQLPNYNLCIISRARNKLVALANIDLSDVLVVSVERCLECESFAVEHFDCAEKVELARSDVLTLHRLRK